MTSRTIAYWITTGFLSLGLFGSGAAKLAGVDDIAQNMTHLGYPAYLMPLLGVWYLAAPVALLAPGLVRAKEWAYAGVAFAMSGALVSHLAVGDSLAVSAPVIVFLALTAASYVLRPADRRVGAVVTTAGQPAFAR